MGGTGRGLAVPCHQSNLAWEAQTDVRDLVSRMYDAAMGHKFSRVLARSRYWGVFVAGSASYFIATVDFLVGWFVGWVVDWFVN